MDYPKPLLTEAWKRVIWHQFHDDLTGTSIPRAYEFSWNDELISMKQFADVLSSSTGSVARMLDTQVKGIPLVIYNPNAWAASDVIEISFTVPKPAKAYTVYNEKGKLVPSQFISNNNGEIKMLVAAEMPSLGYVVYDIRTGSAKSATAIKANEKSLENSIYKLTLDAKGDISSIIDKRNNKELVHAGKSIRLALFTENESFHWPAWEILKKEIDKEPISIAEGVKVTLVESGALRATLCVEKTYGASVFRQYISLNEGGQADRIDVRNEVNWQTTNALLKAEFPLSVSNAKATYDLGVGAVQRGNNTETAYEVYAQHWADLTHQDGSYGVAVMNDSKYGWDKPNDHTMRLTLLHTPKTRGGYAYQDKQDFGVHHFSYAIVGHADSYQDAQIVTKAELFNQTPKAFIAPKHKGDLGKSFSFLQSDNDKIIIKAVKQAETSNDYVVRLYETSGVNKQSVSLSFAGNIIAAKELNGVEDEIGDVSFSNNELKLEVNPFGMKTFKVTLATNKKQEAPTSVALNLPYDLKATSFNDFYSDANFDGKGNSYAAELWTEKLSYKGINFQLAAADVPNALKCSGQEIELPAGNYDRLYLLLASTGKDMQETLYIDQNKHEVVVPSYTGFIGQWGHTGHTEAFLKSTDVAYVGTHKHSAIYRKDLPYEFTYMFAIPIDLPKNAKKLILPDNSRITVFAGSVVKDENNTLAPAVDLLRVYLPEPEADLQAFSRKNLLLGKAVIEKTGEFNERERAIYAIDDDITTKWCDGSINKPKYMTVDMGKVETITGWSVMHAGLEALDYITKEYSLMVKLNETDEWQVVDTVTDNINLETERLLQEPVQARFVRLNITKPDQSEGGTVRINDFQVF
jgi:alpha-mannosidase